MKILKIIPKAQNPLKDRKYRKRDALSMAEKTFRMKKNTIGRPKTYEINENNRVIEGRTSEAQYTSDLADQWSRSDW